MRCVYNVFTQPALPPRNFILDKNSATLPDVDIYIFIRPLIFLFTRLVVSTTVLVSVVDFTVASWLHHSQVFHSPFLSFFFFFASDEIRVRYLHIAIYCVPEHVVHDQRMIRDC